MRFMETVLFILSLNQYLATSGFPGGSDGKESACNAGDLGLIPGLEKSSGGGHGNPLQYSCLKNSTDRRDWRATVHGVKESDTTEWLAHTGFFLPFLLLLFLSFFHALCQLVFYLFLLSQHISPELLYLGFDLLSYNGDLIMWVILNH